MVIDKYECFSLIILITFYVARLCITTNAEYIVYLYTIDFVYISK